MDTEKPIKIMRDGAVAASIWLRQTSVGVFYDVTFSRCWKDEDTGRWGYSQSFSDYHLDPLAELAQEVTSIERHAELSSQADTLLGELGYRNITFLVGDGTLGTAKRGPFDRIMLTAAAAQMPPSLFAQLEEGGILVVPVGSRECQFLQAIHKFQGRPRVRNLAPCRFVPLIGAEGWPE